MNPKQIEVNLIVFKLSPFCSIMNGVVFEVVAITNIVVPADWWDYLSSQVFDGKEIPFAQKVFACVVLVCVQEVFVPDPFLRADELACLVDYEHDLERCENDEQEV